MDKVRHFFMRPLRFVGRQPAKRLLWIGALIMVGALVALCLLTALHHAFFFEGYAANGAFQLLNPLRRITAGEVIGRDFNFFHGLGVPLLHLPFYYLFGQGLVASELARWIVSPLLFFGGAFAFFYAFRRQLGFALGKAAIVTAIAAVLTPFLVLPYTSMLGVRSALPVFLLAVMLLRPQLDKPFTTRTPWLNRYEVAVGLLLALSLICGTEFGVGALLAFFLTNLFYKTQVKSTLRDRFLSCVRIGSLFVAFLGGLLTLITRGNPIEPLKFAFGELPTDQFWYFGVPPNKFLNSANVWDIISSDKLLLLLWATAIIGAALGVWAYRRKLLSRVQSQAFLYGWLAGAFGMISMLGYYHYSEASAVARMSLLIGTAALTLLLTQWRHPLRGRLEVGKHTWKMSLSPAKALRISGLVFVLVALAYAAAGFSIIKKDMHVRDVLAKTKNYVLNNDSNILSAQWPGVERAVMPILQADNNIKIADVTKGDFVHGINPKGRQVIVEPGEHAAFVRKGQIVYFAHAERQIIKKVEKGENGRLVVTLQGGKALVANKDGAPQKLIVAENFNHDNRHVWSLYSGLLEAEMNAFNPTSEGYDYIIHALGQERRQQYMDEFNSQKPDFVLTLTKPYFHYEEWVQNAHWDFYGTLLQNYEVARETPIYVIWKKRDQNWGTPKYDKWQKLSVNEAEKKIDLPKLNFDNVPDLEEYGKAQMKKEYDRQVTLGNNPAPLPQPLRAQEYSEFKASKILAEQQRLNRERENSGNESNAEESRIWVKGLAEEAAKPTPDLHEDRPKRQVILVKVKYDVSHPLQKVPLFGKTPRYMLEPNWTFSHTDISLRPYANEVVFPLVISEKNPDSYLRLKTYSLLPGEGSLKVSEAEWMPLELPEATLKVMTD